MTTPDHTPGLDDLIERVARAACNDVPAREIARAEGAPPFDDSSDVVREYWECITRAALTSANVDALVEALREARHTIAIASRRLTEDHKMVLNGKGWGASTLAKIDAALAHTKEASNG